MEHIQRTVRVWRSNAVTCSMGWHDRLGLNRNFGVGCHQLYQVLLFHFIQFEGNNKYPWMLTKFNNSLGEKEQIRIKSKEDWNATDITETEVPPVLHSESILWFPAVPWFSDKGCPITPDALTMYFPGSARSMIVITACWITSLLKRIYVRADSPYSCAITCTAIRLAGEAF